MVCLAPFFLLLGLAGIQATRPAGQPLPQQAREQEETPEAARQETLREIDQLLSGFTVVEPARLGEVLNARLMEGFLIIELREEPEEWPFVVPIKGQANAAARITISRKPRDASDADSPPTQRFSLIFDRAGEPGADVVITKVHVFAGPLFGQLNLSMDRMHADGTQSSVQLIQLLAGAPDQPPLTLHLSRNRAGAPESDLHAVIPADNLLELSRAEPELFEQFVRPMLAELELAGLFESTVRDMALQAFLRELPVEQETAAKVESLLAELDASDFARREAAQEELVKLGRQAATVLARLSDERDLSPEQSTRVRAILVAYEKAQASQVEARLRDREFLRAVARLQGQEDDAALAELARKRLAELGDEGPSTAPARDEPDDADDQRM